MVQVPKTMRKINVKTDYEKYLATGTNPPAVWECVCLISNQS